MGIEGINGAGMTYQGSVSTAEMKVEAQPHIDAGEVRITSEQLAANTQALNVTETSANGDADQQLTPEQQNQRIRSAVEDINRNANNSEVVFGIHDGTNRVTIKFVDRETKKVIKELPPEKTLDMIAKVWEMAGLLVDEKR